MRTSGGNGHRAAWVRSAPCVLAASLNGVLPAMTAEPGAAPARQLLAQPGPLIIAHRGYSRRAPENTLPAFRLALDAKADLVELDYHHTSDGIPVVLHDKTLDRTTDAPARWGGKKIAVSSKTATHIGELDAGAWFRRDYAGITVPTLQNALALIQPEGCTLIEQKSGDAPTLITLLREHDWLEGVIVQSFDWKFVKDARALAPNLVLGALGPPSNYRGRKLTRPEKELSTVFLREIAELGAQVVGWNDQVTAESVRHAHELGLRIWIYTIDHPAAAARLADLGVDGIITNDPDQIRARLRRRR